MALGLGILAQSAHIRYALSSAVDGLPYRIGYSGSPVGNELAEGQSADVDIWIVVANDIDQALLATVNQSNHYVLVLDEDVPSVANAGFPVWRQRLIEKLVDSSKRLEQARNAVKPAEHLWLLAASTGGLDAVIDFLKQIPSPPSGLGFVYAQHIEPKQVQSLADAIQRATDWKATVVGDGEYAEVGQVSIISPQFQTEIGKRGRVSVSDHPWRGLHKPAIDHLAADIARHYGKRSGMIVFTGMGDDGAKGSRFISKSGGQVWVQSPESCVAASMPEAVLTKGRSHGLADIASLADKLNRYRFGSIAL